MLSEREVAAAIGSTAYGPDGSKIGTVENFFIDDRTGVPTWVSVATGLFGTRHSIAPAAEATVADGGLRLPVTAEAVKAAPRLAGTHLDPAEEQALRTHYGLADPTPHADDVEPAPPSDATPSPVEPSAAEPSDDEPSAVADDDDGDDDGDGDGGMARAEEQLRVGTERVGATRFRLVKYVITEDVQITVPIRREEIRVEEVPVDAAESVGGESLVQHGDVAEGERPGRHTAPDDGSLPEEIILHTERPVVSVEVVPIERVRLHREIVEGTEMVTGQVQREQIVVDQDPGRQV